MVSLVLASKGIEVLEADSGKRGIELALMTRPNLILCDISMGETSGFEVLNQLQQQAQTAQIPFVLMSGLTSLSQAPSEIKECVTLMEKPFSMQKLLKVVSDKLRNETGESVCLTDHRSNRTRQKSLPTSGIQKDPSSGGLGLQALKDRNRLLLGAHLKASSYPQGIKDKIVLIAEGAEKESRALLEYLEKQEEKQSEEILTFLQGLQPGPA